MEDRAKSDVGGPRPARRSLDGVGKHPHKEPGDCKIREGRQKAVARSSNQFRQRFYEPSGGGAIKQTPNALTCRAPD